MELVRNFTELGKNDALSAGGKGASLGEMTRADIPVPPGFVILSTAFDRFIKETDLIQEIDAVLDSVDHREIHTVEGASEKIQALIKNAAMPGGIAAEIKKHFIALGAEYVAVRSSATAEDGAEHAWAGQLDSFLNTTESNLLEKVQACWASLFTPRAIFYRFEKELHKTQISVAVVVQKMVASEVSGIAFSVHPVTEDRNQLIIEAGFGLGEAIVSGQITPDSYVVEKEPRKIIDVNVNTQTRALYRAKDGGNEWRDIPEPKASSQVLNEKQILELSEIILCIEDHYGFPCDIEWAYEAGKFYIVQSRPITTLTQKYENKKITYFKEYSRNYPLFQIVAINECNRRPVREFSFVPDLGRPLYVYSGHSLIDFYYLPGEVQNIFCHFKDLAADTGYFDGVLSKFFKVIEEIKPYFEKKKSAQNIEDLRYLYELYKDYYYGASVVLVVPMIDGLPKEQKEKALYAREQTEHFASLRDELFDYNLGKVFPKLGALTHFVFPSSVFGGKTMEQIIEEANAYKNGFIYFDGNIYTGQQEKILEKLNIKLNNNVPAGKVDLINGQSASSGTVRGLVKIVLTNKDAYKISMGDILVSPMTRPDFISAMEKAAAFVTDEGGITCHAAIVARELKKPCVIGTKIATQVLKDGDLVEVDADKGTVRIIGKGVTSVEMINLQSREHSLVYCHVWQIANQPQTHGWFEPVRNILFVNNGLNKKTKVWYDKRELEDIFINTGVRANEEKDFFDKASKELLSLTDEMSPYFDGREKIGSLEEWKEFYDLWIKWWAPMAVIFVLPESATASEEIKKKALAIRAKTEKYSDGGDAVAMEYLREKYPGYGELVLFMTPDEILRIEILTPSDVEAIEKRKQGYIFFNGRLFDREELDRILETNKMKLDEPEVAASAELKGVCAAKGKVNGRVVVVYGKKDLARVDEGSILVTEMTSPDYVPFIQKAKAVVTDEGGINCHAAIVARELKKPCVIGTKVATQVLKDGDLVEVDADNGVVSKIESTGEGLLIEEMGNIVMPLSCVELHYSEEVEEKIPWAKEDFKVKPFIFYRNDGKKTFFYHDPRGISWQEEHAGKFEQQVLAVKKTKTLFKKVENTLKKESALQRKEFLAFINNIRELWPWVCYMWYAIEYKEKHAQPFDDLLALRKHTEYFTPGLIAVLRNSIKAIYPNKVRFADVILLSEVEQQKIPDDSVLETRLGGYGYTNYKLYAAWQDVVSEFNLKIQEHVVGSNVLIGQTAFPGKVKGSVRIISSRNDMAAFKDGEILVASTTTPDFLPAMKKAAAIVSEHGGAICHAAITSRELKIPCVVGVKGATKVLKDGDLVEVDAGKGTVTIIKRAE